jgi:hypothetical protein
MNLEEIRGFCSQRKIPHKVFAEYPDGTIRATPDTDRKPIVLARVRRYLRTGNPGTPSCVPVRIVREGNPPRRLGPRDRIYYRWYAKKHHSVIRALRDLTAGQFRDGAVARVLVMGFWTRGIAPTLQEFADAWTTANADRTSMLTAEYAYLTDLKMQRAGANWKALRRSKARSALRTLAAMG